MMRWYVYLLWLAHRALWSIDRPLSWRVGAAYIKAFQRYW
jgi:hypothetical protein